MQNVFPFEGISVYIDPDEGPLATIYITLPSIYPAFYVKVFLAIRTLEVETLGWVSR